MMFCMDKESVVQGYFLSSMDFGGDIGLSLMYICLKEFELIDWVIIFYNLILESLDVMFFVKFIEWVQVYFGRYWFLYENFYLCNNDVDKDIMVFRVIGLVEQVIYECKLYELVYVQELVEVKYMVIDEVLEVLGLYMGYEYVQWYVRDFLCYVVIYLVWMWYLFVCWVVYLCGGWVVKSF